MATTNSTLIRHGHCKKTGRSAAYRCWRSMMQRCYRPKDKSYWRYGGKGVTVSDRWHSFVNFLEDMGDPAPGMQIDRIDNGKGYSKENCRWATKIQQMRNRSICRMIEFNGEVKTLAEWSDFLGLNYKMLSRRINGGWDVNKAFTTPKLSKQEVNAIAYQRKMEKKYNSNPSPALSHTAHNP